MGRESSVLNACSALLSMLSELRRILQYVVMTTDLMFRKIFEI